MKGYCYGLRRIDDGNLGDGVLRWTRKDDTKADFTTMPNKNYSADIVFDASAANALYGASETVQTNSLRGHCLIRYA